MKRYPFTELFFLSPLFLWLGIRLFSKIDDYEFWAHLKAGHFNLGSPYADLNILAEAKRPYEMALC